jgi:hypothetical protein
VINAQVEHPAPTHRSISNPVSSELSVQLRSISLEELATAASPVGGSVDGGAACVVAQSVFE